jgi:alanine dehydrogenase
MRIGVPRERMESEYRVALTPAGARELVTLGHDVLVEHDAGAGSGLRDADYERVGARIVVQDAAWQDADLVLKVKEPLADELAYFRDGLIVFTFLHLAAHRELTDRLCETGVVAIGYETVQLDDGRLPLLAPMSEIAGRMAPHVGAHYLEKEHGAGILLGGVSGVRPARVVVLGCGTAGRNAAWLGAGMEAEVLLLDKNIDRLREVDVIHRGRIMTLYSNQETIEDAVRIADLVIGAVLVPGARAPIVVPETLVKEMKPGSVIVDLSIDQGGCVETARTTTHHDPIYTLHDVIHYCVGNVPGAVPHTSTHALTNVTVPYVEAIANAGLVEALRAYPPLARGVNVFAGRVTNAGVAAAHRVPQAPLQQLLAG